MIDFTKKLQEEYLKQETKNKKWHDLFLNKILANGKRFSPFLFNPFNKNNHDTHIRWNNIYLHGVIGCWTREDIPADEKEDFLNELQENDVLEGYRISDDRNTLYIYRRGNDILDVTKFSSLINKNSVTYKNITTSNRNKQCHNGSINIALGSDNTSKLVTGYTRMINSKNSLLHSWVETNNNGNEKVIDYTLNAVISKDAYYSLLNPEPITKISCEDVKRDIPLVLNSEYKGIDNRAYLLYRDEMMKQIQQDNSQSTSTTYETSQEQ